MNSNKVLVILLLIFFYPVGLPLMWSLGVFTRKTRWIITFCFMIALFLGIGSLIIWTSSPGYIH